MTKKLLEFFLGNKPAINNYWLLITGFLLGVFLIGSGYGKLFADSGHTKMVKAIVDSGIPFPEINAFIASAIELIGGLF